MRQRQPELTAMSGIAILFVLLIHACSYCLGYLYPQLSDYSLADWALRFINNLVAPAVPMFLFVSGFKYALRDEHTAYIVLLRKRLPRVIMSFGIINTLFWCLDAIAWMDHFDLILLFKTYITSWMGNTVAYPLWYIPMYCCVIAICPLVCRMISKSWIRFSLYFVVGLIWHVAAERFPILWEFPLRFVIYPVFFELGILAHTYDFRDRIDRKSWLFILYIGLIGMLSGFFPELSCKRLMIYILYYCCGTLILYGASIKLRENAPILLLGSISYPLFLLHEPVIGRAVAGILGSIDTASSIFYVLLWTVMTLAGTIALTLLLKCFKFDRVLWNFSLENK